MKRLIALTLTVALVLCCLVGCNNSNVIVPTDDDIYTDYDGIFLSFSSLLYSDEEKALNVIWHNETNQVAMYTEGYKIEYFEDGEWKSILKGEQYVTSISYILNPGVKRKKTYSTELFDLSKEGTYRLISDFSLDDGTKYNTWVTFKIKNSMATKSYSVTLNGSDEFLEERLNRKYKEGERVIVKTPILMDAAVIVYINGKPIDIKETIRIEGQYSYVEHYFTMPSRNVTVTLEVY